MKTKMAKLPSCDISEGPYEGWPFSVHYEGPRDRGIAICAQIRKSGGRVMLRSYPCPQDPSHRHCFLRVDTPVATLKELVLDYFEQFRFIQQLGRMIFRETDADGHSRTVDPFEPFRRSRSQGDPSEGVA